MNHNVVIVNNPVVIRRLFRNDGISYGGCGVGDFALMS